MVGLLHFCMSLWCTSCTVLKRKRLFSLSPHRIETVDKWVCVLFAGSKPSFGGSKLSFGGSKLSFGGSKLSFGGSKQ